MIPFGVEETAAAVRESRTSARAVVEAALDRIATLDADIGAFVHVNREEALADAEAVDLRHDRFSLALAGVPFAVKDLHDAAGHPTTYGSSLFAGADNASVDSAIVGRLRRAGAVVVGKTNTPAFGWQPDTDGVLHGRTCNPWAPDRSAGGSSGGSAAAVAAGMVPLATGSDTGGSVRIPAALCGVAGFVGTRDRFAATPGPADSLLVRDGPIASTVAGVARAAAVLADPRLGKVGDPPRRIGWSPSPDGGPVDPEIADTTEAAVRRYAERVGADVVEIGAAWPDPIDIWLPQAIVPMLEVAPPDGVVAPAVEPGLARLLDRFEKMSAGEYADVQRKGEAFGRRLHRLFGRFDLIVTPVTAGRAPGTDGKGFVGDEATRAWVRFTYPWNLTRCPVGTVPVGVDSDGLPIGLQVAGPRSGDERVLAAMAIFETIMGFRPLSAHGELSDDRAV